MKILSKNLSHVIVRLGMRMREEDKRNVVVEPAIVCDTSSVGFLFFWNHLRIMGSSYTGWNVMRVSFWAASNCAVLSVDSSVMYRKTDPWMAMIEYVLFAVWNGIRVSTQ